MSGSRGPPPNTEGMSSLKVDNLSYRTSPDDLRRAFGKIGEVGDIYLPRDRVTRRSRGFAFVRYYDKKDAEDALDAMDRQMLDGRELRVQMARYDRPPERRDGGGGGGYGRRGGSGGGGGSGYGRRGGGDRYRDGGDRDRYGGGGGRDRYGGDRERDSGDRFGRSQRSKSRSKSRSRSRSDSSRSRSRSASPPPVTAKA